MSVAQLGRAGASKAQGWEFDSLLACHICGCNSVVEYLVANETVVGSNPTTRSKFNGET